jgi:hypothetical protein
MNGVPRYDPFHPQRLKYASEAVLAEIACQLCETTFLVAFETCERDGRLADLIRAERLSYGDPPDVECCSAGSACGSEMVRVVEYWRRDCDARYVVEGRIVDPRYGEWVRNPDLEVLFSAFWGGQGDPVPPRGPRWKPPQVSHL